MADLRPAALALLGLLALARAAQAEPVAWADWTHADQGAARGTLLDLVVEFRGTLGPPAVLDGPDNLWRRFHPETYTSPRVDSGPDGPDMIRLTGGAGAGPQTLTFSRPVTEPVLAIISLGQPGLAAQFDFDRPFVIESSGPGPWGGGVLEARAGNILAGREGNGLIRFPGTVRSITWTNPVAEFWFGIQVGVPARNKAGLDGAARDSARPPAIILP